MLIRVLTILALLAGSAMGADWPTWQFDPGRIGATPQTLPAQLHLQWTRQLPKRKPMWPAFEAWPGRDAAYEPVVAGNRLFIGAAHDDALACYDTATGDELWRFYAEGPVRFAPVVVGDAVCFATDFGQVYALDVARGGVLWKLAAAPDVRKRMLHDRLASAWPVSAGPVAVGGTLFVAVGVLPADGVLVLAIDIKTGKPAWVSERLDFMPWGYLAFDGEGVVVEGLGGRARLDPKTGQRLDDKPYVAPAAGVLPDTPNIDGVVMRKIVADGKLFAVTLDGRVYCYGRTPAAPQWHDYARPGDAPPPDGSTRMAGLILEKTGRREGLCLVLGLKNGRLAEELLRQSKLRVVVIEADPAVVDAARRYMDKQGLYAHGRLAIHQADPLAFGLPGQVADLIVSEDLAAAGFEAGKTFAHTVFNALHPGGAACLPIGPARQDEFAECLTPDATPGAELVRQGEVMLLIRDAVHE